MEVNFLGVSHERWNGPPAAPDSARGRGCRCVCANPSFHFLVTFHSFCGERERERDALSLTVLISYPWELDFHKSS